MLLYVMDFCYFFIIFQAAIFKEFYEKFISSLL